METTSIRSRLLPAAALCALAAVLAVPAIRWVAARQIGMFAAPCGMRVNRLGVDDSALSMMGFPEEDRLARAAARHPDSFRDQFGAATVSSYGGPGPVTIASRLLGLAPRFPQTALYAAILRYETMGQVRVRLPDGSSPHRGAVGAAGASSSPSRPEDLAAVASAADQGESLDPGNAFFPLMRAVGQFADGEYAEAVASIHRAAGKSRYNDYAFEEAAARDALRSEAFGLQSAWIRAYTREPEQYAHYEQIGAAARLAAATAVRSERAGDLQTGFRIRRDLMTVGNLMCVQSSRFEGSLTGDAVIRVSLWMPGGRPVASSPVETDIDKALQQRAEAYCADLPAIGHGDSVGFVRSVVASSATISRVARDAPDGPIPSDRELAWLTFWWIAGVVLAGNALGMAALTGVAKALSRSRRTEGRAPAFFLLGTLFFVLAVCYYGHTFEVVHTAHFAFANLTDNPPYQELWGLLLPNAAGVLMCLSVPAIVLFVSGTAGARNKVPPATGIVRGLNAVGLPICCVLVLLFAGAVVETSRREDRAAHELAETQRHEGRYLAGLAGMKWLDVAKP